MDKWKGEIMGRSVLRDKEEILLVWKLGCKEQPVEQQKQQLPNQYVTTNTIMKISSRF